MTHDTIRPRIALVGHCGPDSFAIRSAVQAMVPGADVRFVNDTPGAMRAAADGELLLVNRVLDGDFTSTSGLELIRAVVGSGAAGRTMLVSNFADAQQEAESAGALPGFGKGQLYSAAMRERIAAALAPSQPGNRG